MKTKIIYISGSEFFDMSDIRTAFEQVRTAASLPTDTVLFGIPVDSDDALATINTNNIKISISNETNKMDENPQTNVPEITENTITSDITDNDNNTISQNDQVSVTDTDTPKIPKKSRRRIKTESEPVLNHKDTPHTVDETDITSISTTDATPVPILSVLAKHNNNTESVSQSDATDIPDYKPTSGIVSETSETIDDSNDVEQNTIEQSQKNPISIDEEIVANEPDTTDQIENIADKIAENPPMEITTLEELLDGMEPLSEFHETKQSIVSWDESSTENTTTYQTTDATTEDGTDMTLEKLAKDLLNSENQYSETPHESHSKIGKLKNILPFKKAKRDDSGIMGMGDLFGWAGVANDDDFTMPGFFTSTSKK
ncbi:MAG: hypothetical protein MJ187_01570 [Alphaproteobacteria bacterium]|nr:hypothetical protein [Alphaproteobacteria bacterium]